MTSEGGEAHSSNGAVRIRDDTRRQVITPKPGGQQGVIGETDVLRRRQ